MTIYQQNGWTPKDNIVALMSSSWYDASIDLPDFDAVIRNLADGADQYTISKPHHYFGIVHNIHASEKGANIYVSRELTLSARKSQFPDKRLPEPGTPLKLLCDLSTGKPEVVTIEKTEAFDSPDIRYFDGTLRVTGNGYGFVDADIFVHASLVSAFQNHQQTTGAAVAAFDKTKNKYGWKAVSLRCKDVLAEDI
jgi:hypothetical protein